MLNAGNQASGSVSHLHSSPTVSKSDLHYVPSDKAVFECAHCSQVIGLQDELISRAFTGRSGRSFLLNSTINTDIGESEERKLITGTHTVADLFCASCATVVGWLYIKAPKGDQKYKEERYILEAANVVKVNNWNLPRQK